MLKQSNVKPTVKAPALKEGDRVALVAAASRPRAPSVVVRCKKIVAEMGLVPVVGKHVMDISGFMAGSDEDRLADLHEAIADPSIAGIFFLTGGYGTLHLLPFLDYDLIAQHPKVYAGCDDNTALLNAIHAKTGLITFHAPNVEQIRNKYLFRLYKQAVMSTEPIALLDATAHADFEVCACDFYCAVEGSVQGRTVGGNLTALASLLGTPYEPPFQDRIIFLEDINEQNSILDRWFTSLYLSGHLQRAAGAAFGSFENCNPRGAVNMLSIMDTFGDRMQYLRKPGCFGFPFGQFRDTSIVPIGVNASLDCSAGKFEFLESALA